MTVMGERFSAPEPGYLGFALMSRRNWLFASAACLLLLAGCEPLTSDELQHEAGSIHSTAAEGALLADGVARQRTLSSFVRAHAKELADAADTSARKLHDASVPGSCDSALARPSISPLGPPRSSETWSFHPAIRSRQPVSNRS